MISPLLRLISDRSGKPAAIPCKMVSWVTGCRMSIVGFLWNGLYSGWIQVDISGSEGGDDGCSHAEYGTECNRSVSSSIPGSIGSNMVGDKSPSRRLRRRKSKSRRTDNGSGSIEDSHKSSPL